MFNDITVEKMLGGLEGQLGEDDYSEPLEILINSANKNNQFNVFGAFAFKNQLKEFKIFHKSFNNYLVNIIILFLVIFYILSIRIPHCCNLQKNNIDLYGGILNKSVAIINVLFISSNQEKYDLNKRFK